ncbi:hypothetical protein JOD43_004343 [Pullulanibacillus pueri]|nr:hypothetical protein [Pullulanibacillus pueri]
MEKFKSKVKIEKESGNYGALSYVIEGTAKITIEDM